MVPQGGLEIFIVKKYFKRHAYPEAKFWFSTYMVLMAWNAFPQINGLDVAFHMSFGPVLFSCNLILKIIMEKSVTSLLTDLKTLTVTGLHI